VTRDMRLYIQDILESIEAIEEYVQFTTEEQFYGNRQLQDAVLRRLEVIGEAVNPVRNSSGALTPRNYSKI